MRLLAGNGIVFALIFSACLTCAAVVVKPPEKSLPQRRPGLTNLDLNYPGIGVRTFLSDRIALEARVQFDRSNIVAGLRHYWYPAFAGIGGRFWPYLCVEGDYVTFKEASAKGNGFGIGTFAGIEYALNRYFTLQIDAGPEFFFIKNKNNAATSSDLEFILGLGLNYYFK